MALSETKQGIHGHSQVTSRPMQYAMLFYWDKLALLPVHCLSPSPPVTTNVFAI